jgi:hypothetical protein
MPLPKLDALWLLNCPLQARLTAVEEGTKRAQTSADFLANSRGKAVLKITITDFPGEQRWSLHGQLAGQWAAELKLRWTEARQAGDARRCIVELIEVTSIDRNGQAVLSELMSAGVEFIATDVYTKHLLRNLRSELKRSRTKGKQDGGGKH